MIAAETEAAGPESEFRRFPSEPKPKKRFLSKESTYNGAQAIYCNGPSPHITTWQLIAQSRGCYAVAVQGLGALSQNLESFPLRMACPAAICREVP
jgi:hypothetical protein